MYICVHTNFFLCIYKIKFHLNIHIFDKLYLWQVSKRNLNSISFSSDFRIELKLKKSVKVSLESYSYGIDRQINFLVILNQIWFK